MAPRRPPPNPPHTSRSARDLEQRSADLEQRLLSRPATGSASGSDPTKNTNARNADALRVQVCELLADALLLDPSWAVRRKVPDRLWRTCFYGQISQLRAKIAKEHHRRRQKKDHHTSRNPSSAATTIAALEQHLVVFLGEAITLYDYLCQRLWDRLRDDCHATSNNNNNNNDDAPTLSSQSSTTATAAAATVECLHRLSVCLGDLHRYSSSSSSGSNTSVKSAEAAYRLAARLGPGHGHPANQLGVMCGAQVVAAASSSNVSAPNPSALALYWYARALLATHEPFETAPINLGRLFQANDDWLRAIAASCSAGQGSSPPPPPAATRFLAHYVQLHGLLFRLLHRRRDETDRPPVNDANEDADSIGEFERLLGPVLDSFQTLLQQSALGDGLLVKLVCIQAFSECFDPSKHGGRERRREAPDTPLPAVVVLGGGGATGAAAKATAVPPPTTHANRLARIVTLSLGCRLADRVLTVWQQRSGAGGGGGTSAPSPAPSARLLLPLALLTEYAGNPVREWDSGNGDNNDPSTTVRCTTLAQAFWDKVANIFNVVEPPHQEVGESNPLPTGKARQALPEYAELRGFLPFQAFLPDDDESTDGFASPTDALEVWADDHGAGKSEAAEKESNSTAAPSKGGASHRSRVVAHLRAVGWDLARQQQAFDSVADSRRSGLPGRLIVSDHGHFSFVPSPLAESGGGASKESLEDHDHGGDDEDDGGDDVHMAFDDPLVLPGDRSPGPPSPQVLVYQESKSGGPALLVPGALVQPPLSLTAPPALLAEPTAFHSAAAATGFERLNTTIGDGTTAMEITRTPMDENSYVDRRLSSSSVINEAPASEAMAVEPEGAAILPPPGFGPAAPLEMPASSSLFGFDPASLLSTWGGPTAPGAPDRAAAPPPMSVLESLSLYGAPGFWLPPTANPFAAPAPSLEPLPPQPPPHPDGLWMVDSIASGSDVTSLLDSELLRSLRGDDEYDDHGRAPTTKNPFAA